MKKLDPSYKDFIKESPDRPGVLQFGGVRMVLLDIKGGFGSLRDQIEGLVGQRLADFTLKQAGIQGGSSFAKSFTSHTNGFDSPSVLKKCLNAYQAAGFGQFTIADIEWPIGFVKIRGIDTFESWMYLKKHQESQIPVCSYTAGVMVGFVNVIADRDDIVCLKHSCQAMGDDECLFELLPVEEAGEVPAFVRTPSRDLGSQLSLLEISRNIAANLELEPLLSSILEELKSVVDYCGSNILTIDGSDLVVRAYTGQMSREEAFSARFPLDDTLSSKVIRGRKPVIVTDTHGDSPEAIAFRKSLEDKDEKSFAHIRSWMGVPLIVKDRVIGELALDHIEPNYFQPEDAELTFAYANQVAVAIENAQLYQQAQQVAVLEERNRLARELHDSVSQALYGIALGARTTRKLLDQENISEEAKSKLGKPIEYVLDLANSGLTEMRSLIFELRPDMLDEQGIVVALERLVTSIQSRHQVEVCANLCREPILPFEVKEAIYRVAQEALNNVIKHAKTKRAHLSLEKSAGYVTLLVKDDGVGFDLTVDYPGHLGLSSMRERVFQLGGSLEITSVPGSGTQLQCKIPLDGE
jgi:signal transduction histidine kinase